MSRAARIAVFLAVAYGISGGLGLLLSVTGLEWTGATAMVLGVLLMYSPAAGALLANKLSGRGLWEGLAARPRLSRWILVGSAVGLGVGLGSVAVGLLLPSTSLDTSGVDAILERFGELIPADQHDEVRAQVDALPLHPFWLSLPQVVGAGLTINALAAFGEELGWRGFLERELAPLGFWRASLLTGVLWGFWHAPVILHGHNYPQHPVPGVFLFVAFCVLASPLHSWVRRRGGSVWAAAVLHGTLNAGGGLAYLVTRGGSDLEVGLAGIAGVATLGLGTLALALGLRGRPVEDRALGDGVPADSLA